MALRKVVLRPPVRSGTLLFGSLAAGIALGEGIEWRAAGFLLFLVYTAGALKLPRPLTALCGLWFCLGLWRGSSLQTPPEKPPPGPYPTVFFARVALPPARRPGLPVYRTTLRRGSWHLELTSPFRPSCKTGDVVQVTGTFRPEPATRNPGDAWLYRGRRAQRFLGFVHVYVRDQVVVVESRPTVTEKAAEILRRRIKDTYRETTRGLAFSLFAGDRRLLDAAVRENFRRAGMAHLLAISGLHVGLVAWFVIAALRRAAPGSSRIVEAALPAGCFAAWCYAGLAGFPPSAMRASLAATTVTVLLLFRVRPDLFSILLAVSGAVLVVEPSYLWSLSFELSLTAVLGILRFALPGPVPPLVKRLRGTTSTQAALRKWVFLPLRIAVGAFIGTVPVMAYHFGALHPWAIPASVAACPLLTVALGSGGLALAFPFLSFPFGCISDVSLEILLLLSEAIAELPGNTVSIPPLSGSVVLIAVCLLFLESRPTAFLSLLCIVLASFFPAQSLLPRGITVFQLQRGQAVFCRIAQPEGDDFTLLYLRCPPPSFLLRILRYLRVRKVSVLVLATPGARAVVQSELTLRQEGASLKYGSLKLQVYPLTDGSVCTVLAAADYTVSLGVPPPVGKVDLIVGDPDPAVPVACETRYVISTGSEPAGVPQQNARRVFSVHNEGALRCRYRLGVWEISPAR